jgi:uncharacterized protein (DUF302 family)
MSQPPGNGVVNLRSPYTVANTLQRLESIIAAKGLTIFALVDHSGEAEKVNLTMPPTKLLLFGSPKAGTPLMIASPSLALDLPLKALVWQAADGAVWLSYNSPEFLQQRHNIPEALIQNIAGIRAICEQAVQSP